MEKRTDYQGWTNYETWLVALWIGNDKGLYEMVIEWAKEMDDTVELADAIQEFIEGDNPLVGEANLYSDMLGGSLREVNWKEVAEKYIKDVKDINK